MASRRPFHSFRTDSPPTLDSLSFTRCLDNKSIPDRVWNLATYPWLLSLLTFRGEKYAFKGSARGGGPMPDSRYCAPPGNKSDCVFYRARETHRARPAERITIRERVYRGEAREDGEWRGEDLSPSPFDCFQPRMNIRLLSVQ